VLDASEFWGAGQEELDGQGAEYAAGMAGGDGASDVAEVEEVEEGVAGEEFEEAFCGDDEEGDPSGFSGEWIGLFDGVECVDGEEAVGDAGESAEAGIEGGGEQAEQEAAEGGGADVEQASTGLVAQFVEKEEKGGGIEEEVIEADVYEGEGDELPPVARKNTLRGEDERGADLSEKERQVDECDECGEEEQLGSVFHGICVGLKAEPCGSACRCCD
jgi:hypothetical protein